MNVQYITNAQCKKWDTFVAQEKSFSLLQSYAWGKFKEKFGWKVYRIAVLNQGQIVAGAQMLIKPILMGLASVAYIPRGPIGAKIDTEAMLQLLCELHQSAQHHKAIFLKIEPPLLNNLITDQLLQQHQFQPSPHTNQPRATLIVDLAPSIGDIFERLHRKTRYKIKYAERKGVTVRIGDQEDLSVFYNLMQITSRRCKFPIRSRPYYEEEWRIFNNNKQVALFIAYYQDQPLAVRTVFSNGNHAADFHAASQDKHRHLRHNLDKPEPKRE